MTATADALPAAWRLQDVLAASRSGWERSGPKRSQAEVWVLTFDASSVAGDSWPMLSASEMRDVARINAPRRAASIAAGRAFARAVVSIYTGQTPAEVELSRIGGRPVLGCGLYLSLSHSDGVAAVAVAATPVGVDCETPARVVSPSLLARATPSRGVGVTRPDDWDQLWPLRRWTTHEALIKASDGKPQDDGWAVVSWQLSGPVMVSAALQGPARLDLIRPTTWMH